VQDGNSLPTVARAVFLPDGKHGEAQEGLRVLAEAQEEMNKTDEQWYKAELHRLKGELLLLQSSDNHTEAETSFHQAITIARHQQAKFWELRATTSLARLWQSQDKRQDAYDLLAPVYEWFSEGFDTADFMDAKQLLAKLSVESSSQTG
jgi:predicted ATPase